MSLFGDRRAAVRYEVVGTLRGTLERSDAARLVDVSDTGATIETVRPVEPGSVHVMELRLGRRVTRVNASVVRRSVIGSSCEGPVYAVGLEFSSPHESIVAAAASLAQMPEP